VASRSADATTSPKECQTSLAGPAHGVRDVEHIDALQRRQVHDLESVRRHELPRPARRLAARIRLAGKRGLMAFVGQRAGPGLQRYLIDVHPRRAGGCRLIGIRIDDEMLVATFPHAGLTSGRSEIDVAVRPARRWSTRGRALSEYRARREHDCRQGQRISAHRRKDTVDLAAGASPIPEAAPMMTAVRPDTLFMAIRRV